MIRPRPPTNPQPSRARQDPSSRRDGANAERKRRFCFATRVIFDSHDKTRAGEKAAADVQIPIVEIAAAPRRSTPVLARSFSISVSQSCGGARPRSRCRPAARAQVQVGAPDLFRHGVKSMLQPSPKPRGGLHQMHEEDQSEGAHSGARRQTARAQQKTRFDGAAQRLRERDRGHRDERKERPDKAAQREARAVRSRTSRPRAEATRASARC